MSLKLVHYSSLPLLLLVFGGLEFSPTSALAQRNAREMVPEGEQLPTWEIDPSFIFDTFTFVRVRYSVDGTYGIGHVRDRWLIDAPDSDLNFSWRLHQLTSLSVHPDGNFISMTDLELAAYPFIYIVEPGRLHFEDEELVALRKYLLNGGFLMFDDFWGEREGRNLLSEMKRLFPDRDSQPLSLEHAIFHCVFDLKAKPQVPNVETGIRSEYTKITYEGRIPLEPDYRGIYDDRGRLMILMCHNTDNGDGWEREGESEYYFREFSEKKAYPLGINIIFYTMTH